MNGTMFIKAALLLKNKYNIKTGVKIFVKKNIPVAAGLGGGSTDCAAALRGINQLWNLGCSLEELAEIGLEVGTDVPYCVYGSTAFVGGKGKKSKYYLLCHSAGLCWSNQE